MTRERVVLVTPVAASAAVCEGVPAIAAAISDFRSQFEVELLLSPLVKGGTPAGTYEEFAAALRSKLTPGWHIVAMGFGGTLALSAANGRHDVATLVVSDLLVSPATFRALGMVAAAHARQAMQTLGAGGGYIRLIAGFLEGAPEDTARRLLALVERDLDQQRVARWDPILREINLLDMASRLTVPTLFLAPQEDTVNVGTREVVLRLVPNAEVGELESWPHRVHERETGHEFAQKAIAFIERHRRAE
jgi:pimeloyl-ACP methyl ester carboxylesterase